MNGIIFGNRPLCENYSVLLHVYITYIKNLNICPGLICAFVQHQSFPRQGSYWFSVFVNNTDIASIEQSTDPTIDIYLYG